ncbi:alpha-amylase family glycosyl hydrolase [Egicoccus sp. AB-alg6-2]|uniref:alpha-amylase family glycosyl hydrolase n=1 Tax=Egicoccus sp. AB-alg6-2 TaxID=3242692 RepID=UPI00359EA1C8
MTWWQGAVGYEIYVRSFADSDGDGVGDLPGIRQRLPYLADLGVDLVWITPFYPSPQADHGYDVSDYLGVEPTYGSVDDAVALIDRAHELGLKVIFDLVPNHSSSEHPWFRDARSSRDATHRDWYVWRDPAPDGGPPNNWVSNFGGPAWTYDEASGQYWMHLFLPEQPDLNWANEDVRAAFVDVIDTWFTRGVDGIRIDVAHALVKDEQFRDNPVLREVGPDASPRERFRSFDHRFDQDQEGVLDIYREWNQVASKHDAMLLGEVYLLETDRLRRYVERRDGLHLAFAFATLHTAWDVEEIRTTLGGLLEAAGENFAWPLGSHDDPRAATRFGGGELGARRARAYLTLLCGLPGVPFLYQGDELGLDDGELADDSAQDPIAVRNPGAKGRDPVRTPMLWEPGEGFGFTNGAPWLPFGDNRRPEHTVAAQTGRAGSPLERTRELLRARRALPALRDGSTWSWLTDAGPVLALLRSERRGEADEPADIVVALHVGSDAASDAVAELTLPRSGRLAYASADGATVSGATLRLPADTAVFVELAP